MIIQNKKLDAIDPIEASKLTAEHGYLIIENSGATPEEFAEWNLHYGYNISPDIWCTDKDHSEYFWRVTNQTVDGKNKGLFADDELDWHSNLVPHCDAQEVVGLFGKTITYHTETWICSSIPFYQTLDEDTKNLLKTLNCVLWHASEYPPMNQPWKPDWNFKYSPEILEGIKTNRSKSFIQNSTNISIETKNKFNKFRGVAKSVKLIPNHPLGTKGLFFQPYDISSFILNGKEYSEGYELYQMLWNDWVCSDKYTYKHVWKPGDIMLMDQLTTIHRRPDVLKDKPRELLRTACWYKEEVRQHFDYVL